MNKYTHTYIYQLQKNAGLGALANMLKTLATKVPTLASKVPTLASNVGTLATKVPTLASKVPTLASNVPSSTMGLGQEIDQFITKRFDGGATLERMMRYMD